MFKWWHKLGEGAFSRTRFQDQMVDVQNDVGRLLQAASLHGNSRMAGMARKIIKVEDALWTFVDQEGVEPTNNFGERVIRGAVMWRKLCFGTDSRDGSRFVDRIMTTVSTLRLLGRPVLEYLTDAYRCHLKNVEGAAITPIATKEFQRAA